jgi:uroporphyrinogen-III decarboxylase
MTKEIAPKKLVRGAFERTYLPRLPFVPWIFTHAARLEQIPVKRMFTDATQYVKCLQNARKLYGYDVITGSFDPSLEMEIGGCSVNWGGDYEIPAAGPLQNFNFGELGNVNVEEAAKTGRFGTVIESLRRINMVSGPDLALAAVVSGPLTLATGLTGRDIVKDFIERPEEAMSTIDDAAAFLLKIVKVYCQLQLDIIAIADRLMASIPEVHLAWLRSTLSPTINTVRFYDAFSVLLPGESSPDNIAKLMDLGFDGIVAAGIDLNTWNEITGTHSCVLGKAIPSRLLTASKEELQQYLDTILNGDTAPGVFLTTDGEVPADTPPDNIHLVMDILSKKI